MIKVIEGQLRERRKRCMGGSSVSDNGRVILFDEIGSRDCGISMSWESTDVKIPLRSFRRSSLQKRSGFAQTTRKFD